LVATISGSTIWRWLHQDAIRPWHHRCWVFPRDPQFATKAGRILDLYARTREGKPLREDEFVISADEKTSIQARRRIHATSPPQSHRPMLVEHEYARCGAWAYLAALDVHHARVFGRCESTTSIAPFDRLAEQVMTRPPYNEARRVFWVVDNGSSHRGAASVARLRNKFRRLQLVHGPVHAIGSTRSRSASRSFSARFSPPTISPGCRRSLNVCSIFSTTGKRRPSSSNGSSRAVT
jgi:hypothetical protein